MDTDYVLCEIGSEFLRNWYVNQSLEGYKPNIYRWWNWNLVLSKNITFQHQDRIQNVLGATQRSVGFCGPGRQETTEYLQLNVIRKLYDCPGHVTHNKQIVHILKFR
jgi:hypothetical protein